MEAEDLEKYILVLSELSCQGWCQDAAVSRAGDHAGHVSPPRHHVSRVSGPETQCQEVAKV